MANRTRQDLYHPDLIPSAHDALIDRVYEALGRQECPHCVPVRKLLVLGATHSSRFCCTECGFDISTEEHLELEQQYIGNRQRDHGAFLVWRGNHEKGIHGTATNEELAKMPVQRKDDYGELSALTEKDFWEGYAMCSPQLDWELEASKRMRTGSRPRPNGRDPYLNGIMKRLA